MSNMSAAVHPPTPLDPAAVAAASHGIGPGGIGQHSVSEHSNHSLLWAKTQHINPKIEILSFH